MGQCVQPQVGGEEDGGNSSMGFVGVNASGAEGEGASAEKGPLGVGLSALHIRRVCVVIFGSMVVFGVVGK